MSGKPITLATISLHKHGLRPVCDGVHGTLGPGDISRRYVGACHAWRRGRRKYWRPAVGNVASFQAASPARPHDAETSTPFSVSAGTGARGFPQRRRHCLRPRVSSILPSSPSSIEATAQAVEPAVQDSNATYQPDQSDGPRRSRPFRYGGVLSLSQELPASPPQVHEREPAAAQPVARRAPPQVVTAEHYRRHTGVPGFLYIAHNDEHRTGLFKLGYTTLSPQARMASLNKAHEEASDIGVFHLVHSVPVAASYDAEQALFDAITAQRVAERREFFYGSQEALIGAVNAAARLTYGDADPLNTIYADSSTWATASQGMAPSLSPVRIPPRQGLESGWIYICRNPWHRDDTFRVSFTKVDPIPRLEELNSGQRRNTSQIGFYQIVHCVLASHLKGATHQLQKMLAPYRIRGSRVFYRASLPVLQAVIDAVVSAGPTSPNQLDAGIAGVNGTATTDPTGEHRPITVEPVHGSVHYSWAAWTAACPACRVRLRFKGQIGARGNVNCPSCDGLIFTYIGANHVRIEAGLPIDQ
jgi:hypothetical protein